MSTSDVEATIKRISSHPGVRGLIVQTNEGTVVRTTFDPESTKLYSSDVAQFAAVAKSAVRDLDPINDLSYVRVRSTSQEIICIPEKQYTIIVVCDAPEH
ncbi:Dynein light chain roadblock-type 1/2 like protein [Aduncisulcus paluster]|uniref:Dynein light chain roadblock n=1 Tax=Aduncisulcus paluster TaxID=2918883 RepID=A0ABQ5KTX3_9EUKA|nr:Dynein light chain roadblock-type 1/2 like protein [Aduncisulcus paluster]|eukprot:gnl/Carplike_NY0171/2749_a3695_756.p1 GENE.gnl/Carplike_NY0171/2749_a3695_756~~gnl/Carplike_NY0171/2749_a3695_756.p1  ORF type:complete len:100 (-),score=11.22 gnl/Carplike_NY0171/2749_a3695_756:102-401(-)